MAKMAIDLPNLSLRVFNAPLLVHPDKLDTILSAVGARILSGADIEPQSVDLNRSGDRPERGAGMPLGAYMASDSIAVLPIVGTLVRRSSYLGSMSGMMSYDAIGNAVTRLLASPDVSGLILEMDSHGGEAGGCFDLATLIRAMSEATGKPVWAHVNEYAESAGYALATSAEEIWIARTGVAGSIGVVAAHVDLSKADEKAGQKWTYIHAGENKTAGNSHEPLTTNALNAIQADVDDLYSMFIDLVSSHRGIAAQNIRDTKADSFRGSHAIEAGLTDNLGTLDDAVTSFEKRLKSGVRPYDKGATASKIRRTAMASKGESNQNEGEGERTGVETAPEAASKVSEPLAGGGAAEAVQRAAQQERERCAALSELASQARALGVDFNLANAITANVSAEAARASVLAAAANADAARPTATTRKTEPGEGRGLSQPGARSAVTPEKARGMWAKALARN